MAETENKPQGQPGAAQPAGAQEPAASQPQQAGSQVTQQLQGRPCPKDCSKCSWGHQIYCTAKMTFDSFSVLNAIIQRLDALSAKMDALTEKVDAQSEKIAELSGRIAAIESDQSEFATPMPVQGDLFKEKT